MQFICPHIFVGAEFCGPLGVLVNIQSPKIWSVSNLMPGTWLLASNLHRVSLPTTFANTKVGPSALESSNMGTGQFGLTLVFNSKIKFQKILAAVII